MTYTFSYRSPYVVGELSKRPNILLPELSTRVLWYVCYLKRNTDLILPSSERIGIRFRRVLWNRVVGEHFYKHAAGCEYNATAGGLQLRCGGKLTVTAANGVRPKSFEYSARFAACQVRNPKRIVVCQRVICPERIETRTITRFSSNETS